MSAAPLSKPAPAWIDTTKEEVEDAALRLMKLLDRPTSLPILQSQILRELHFWLLAGKHGSTIRSLGITESHAQRIGRAIAAIKAEFAKPFRIEDLAAVAGMSVSSFHEHFRAVTSLTPLQFQKQLRLMEARRLMIAEGETTSRAAYTVGYESIPQFTREYGRMFGLPPARDVKTAKGRAQAE